MTNYLGKSCSLFLPRVPFVNCRQFMYLIISLLVLRAGYGIWLYQFLIIAYLFTLFNGSIVTTLLGNCLRYLVPMFPMRSNALFDYRIAAFILGKSCFLTVLGAYVCPWGLTGLFDDRIVITLLGKSCFHAVRGAYACPWGLTGLFDDKMVTTLLEIAFFLR